MLRYYRKDLETGNREEITHERALDIVLGTYWNNDMTRDMLKMANRIQCLYSIIEVYEEEQGKPPMCLMPGLYNMLPMDVEYDDGGNRI